MRERVYVNIVREIDPAINPIGVVASMRLQYGGLPSRQGAVSGR